MSAGSCLGLSDAARPRAARGQHVAVVARDELDARRVSRALEREGFHASLVYEPNGAAEAPQRPDALVVLAGEGRYGEDEPRTFREWLRDIPTVVVSRRSDRAAVDEVITAGATGFVTDDQLEERLGPTVRAVLVGQVVVPADHRDALAQPILSPREKQVLSMVVLGFTNREVANKLHVTETTVKSHLSSAYRKLRVRSRHEATALILSDKNLGLGILALAGERQPS
jgi:DNA-binding NarL/FixJ family response regulator